MARETRTFAGDEHGATAVEYALMATLIALAIITGVSGIGFKLSSYFSEVSSAIK